MATCNFMDPDLQEDTDQESGKDSDNEIDQWVDGTPQQKRHIRRRSIGLPSDSSEDEFEKEMMSELDNEMSAKYPLSQCATSKKKQQEAENDALFYDPKMDDEDERWVKEQREAYKPTDVGSSAEKNSKKLKSDAVLNCPACMCTVCLDCQRHSIYDNQYRAMFTLNTLVNYGETLQFKKKRQPKNKRKRKLDADLTASESGPSDFADMERVDPELAANQEQVDCYYPVNCSNCKTRLAVYDSDEVYHFFNVISSYS